MSRGNLDPCTLATLVVGQEARVVSVEGDDALARRLTDLGFWTGVPVRPVQTALFGDPKVYHLHGYRLALRNREAERVRVEQVTDAL